LREGGRRGEGRQQDNKRKTERRSANVGRGKEIKERGVIYKGKKGSMLENQTNETGGECRQDSGDLRERNLQRGGLTEPKRVNLPEV